MQAPKILEGRLIELIVSVKISYGESTAGVLVDDAFKGCHYGLERPGSTVLGSKEINTFRVGMEEYISIDKNNPWIGMFSSDV